MEKEDIEVYGYGAQGKDSDLMPVVFARKTAGKGEVAFRVTHCGVCHSDLHQARNDWGNTIFPCVPGHEIVGTVTAVGEGVDGVAIGDIVGVGCMIDSCQSCEACEADEENYCQGEKGATLTYNGPMNPDGTNTYGGYSSHLVVRQEFILKIPSQIEPQFAGPVMCAGITVYSPMRHWNLQKGETLGVAGIGGLGHMAIKIGKALGAKVVALTRDESKRQDILAMGADEVIVSKNGEEMRAAAASLDMLINTIPVPHDISPYLELMRANSHVVIVGNLVKFPEFSPGSLVMKRISLSGSLIGGIKETQEVLELCAEHDIRPSIKLIDIEEINEVFNSLAEGNGDGHYRHVIDMESLRKLGEKARDSFTPIPNPARA